MKKLKTRVLNFEHYHWGWLATVLLFAWGTLHGCSSGGAEDHYSTGRIVRIYYSYSNNDTTYKVDFVPDNFPSDTTTLVVDEATFQVAEKGDRVDYQKLRNQ